MKPKPETPKQKELSPETMARHRAKAKSLGFAYVSKNGSYHGTAMRPCERCAKPFEHWRAKTRFCTRECNLEWYDESRTKARSGGPGKGWARGKEYVPRSPCLACGKPFYAPPVQRRRGGGKYCSNQCYVRIHLTNPKNYPRTKSRRGNGGKRPDLGNTYFRSSWEANWARYLNWLKAHGKIAGWEFEPKTFEFVKIKRGSKFYTPDFLVTAVDGSQVWHEVKGYMDARSATKLKRMAKYFPQERVELIDKDRYRNIAQQVAQFIPTWEGVRGRAAR